MSQVYVRTNVAGYYFDLVARIQHVFETTVTKHPVQSGANISDHAYNEPAQITLTIGISDTGLDITKGQYNNASSKSVSAFQVFQRLRNSLCVMSITTRFKIYYNMMITQMQVIEDKDTQNILAMSLTLSQILTTSSVTIALQQTNLTISSTDPQTTGVTLVGDNKIQNVLDKIVFPR